MWNSIEELQSTDTDVKKYIFKKDDAIAEAVLYKYGTYNKRTVMCISTQTGCEMGCTFCGTGKFFGRDLNTNEILDQVIHMVEHNNLDMDRIETLQIMVMSMGEPLNNMLNLYEAFNILNLVHPKARLLVSTAAPKTNKGWSLMMDMAKEIDTVGLQFSVHASTDSERDKIMPMKGKLSLEEIAYKGLEFYQKTGRKPYFNYCVTKDNASDIKAQELRMLFDPRVWEATLSVVCSSDQSMQEAHNTHLDIVTDFSRKLVELGFNTRVFDPAGQDDIGGGCGQLWAVQNFAENNSNFRQSAGNKILCREI